MKTKTFTSEWRPTDECNQIIIGRDLILRMQKAGVPVLGCLWPMAVSRGTLTSTYDDVFSELTYVWRDE